MKNVIRMVPIEVYTYLYIGRIHNRNNFIIKIDIFVNGKNQRRKSIVRIFLKVCTTSTTRMEKNFANYKR